jgi:hypothetical protein
MKFFRDILTEINNKTNSREWSQGRVYLMISVIAYYAVLTVLTVAGMHRDNNVDLNKFRIVIDALEFAMVLFGGYVFGGKIVSVFNAIKSPEKESEK